MIYQLFMLSEMRKTNIMIIRKAQQSDRTFIFTLSPHLAEVAKLKWHSDKVMQKMQDDYITEMLEQTSVPQMILIAEKDKIPLGFIHACEYKDNISGEVCATVTLLAVSPKAQGTAGSGARRSRW